MKKVHLINYIDIDIIGYFEALCEIKNAKTLTYSTEQTDVTCKKCLKILEKKGGLKMICEHDNHRIKPDIVIDDNGLTCFYCRDCFKTFDSLMEEYISIKKIKVGEIVVKTAKIDAIIEFIKKDFKYYDNRNQADADLIGLLEDLKK